ncbi:MAG: type II secretion system protein [Bacilli bacterium]|nr:type II secretion system protein [Bacilli bacterium]
MKKGFTLIELLAVIVILAVIALIAVPSIMGIITKAKRGAAEGSAHNYVKAVETSVVTSQLNGENLTGYYNVNNLEDKVLLKGTKPSSGNVTLANNGKVEEATLCINGLEVKYDGTYAKVVSDNCSNITNPTYTIYANGTSIYFNPVTGLTCTAAEAVSTPGTKTGCMKWYTFNDGGASTDTINLILDHNTTADIAWNYSGNKSTGPIEVMTQLASDTSSWAGIPTRTDSYTVNNATANYTIDYSTYKARLITAQEIAQITGNLTFNEVTATWENDAYYLDSNTRTQMATTIGASNYDWLFDYTEECTNYGCNIADSSSIGYWTATAVRQTYTAAWDIIRSGFLNICDIRATEDIGLRPVITIPKSSL